MSKVGTFIKTHRFLSICLLVFCFLIILVLLCFSVRWLLWSPESKLAHRLRYPSRQVSVPICSFISPAGWSVSINDKYDPNHNQKCVSMLGWLFEKADEFPDPWGPYVAFRFGKNMNEAIFLSAGIGKFMVDAGVSPQNYEVDGKELLIWRYEGKKFLFPKNKPDYVAESEKYKSISIAFCGKDFGFYGSFWGFPEHEHDFWDVIKSIQWKL